MWLCTPSLSAAPAPCTSLEVATWVGALVPILAMTDFRVVVCDQRSEAASQEALPQAAEVYCLPYEDAFAHLPPGDGGGLCGHHDPRPPGGF